MRRLLLISVLAMASSPRPTPAQDLTPQQIAATQQKVWQDMKRQLQGPNGKQFFEVVLKDGTVPGRADGIEFLRGVVVGSKPSKHPTDLVIAMSDDHTPEVTLTLRDSRQNLAPLLHPIAPGNIIEFFGIPVLFTQNPFMLTFEVRATNGPSGANPRFLTKTPPKK